MFCSIYLTFPTEQHAMRICEVLLEKQLIACANLFPVHSLYRWKGELCDEKEWAAVLKGRSEQYDIIEKAVIEMHPYDVPCIVKYDIVQGHRPYLDWINESINAQRSD